MSLLQGVLRPHTPQPQQPTPSVSAEVTDKLNNLAVSREGDNDDSDEDIIGVMSVPGTPRSPRSRAISRSSSPTRTGASTRRAPGPLHLTSTTASSLNGKRSTDPLRALPTEITQRIFGRVGVKSLARCSRVCKKWNKSQSLNYVWFQQYRKHELRDDSLPTGKWTRRESKENWRLTYLKSVRLTAEADGTSSSRYGYATPPTSGLGSGYATPREVREERWAQENVTSGAGGAGLGKVEMREMYKELGGRKSRTKNKLGAGRDKGGWQEPE